MPSADRLIELFSEAKSRPTGTERDSFLSEACRDAPELKQQVLSLLHAHESAGDFLAAGPPLPPEFEGIKPEVAGEQIGPYKLREQIGEGGFGVVWVAEQEKPVRRMVALKIIKLGMDTREVVARFEQERQALAMMEHANIAKVFDAGATVHGRPYFVMELVRGIKITDYCDRASLSTMDRLALFIEVCHAVQHAHQKGIIHRDLKPSNILVTLHDGVPVPKVIDFGVAKATQGRLSDLSIYTRFEQMIGTPLYMSPEQAEMSGLDIDTRADIYALGVLLYELITGRTPFDPDRLLKVGYDEMRRVIREEEPPKPSTALNTMAREKLTTVAQHRSSEPPKLIHAIHGDLDWIVMKTLEKDRSRRYETASSLASDIQRHLANEPVMACPPSAIYRFRKFARRNRGALAIAALASLAMLLALAGLAVSNVLITKEKNQKVAALEQAKINEEAAHAQRGIAERNAIKAREQERIAEANEKKAKASELLARRRYYAAQMNLAMQAWQAGESPRVLELLEGQRPKPDEEDLRGFEWFHLWRLCRGGNRVPIRGHDRAVLGMAFSPDGKTLASASWDWTVRLWDTTTGKEQKVLRGNQGPWEVVFSPDGKTLASSGQEAGSMVLWNVADGTQLHRIAGSVEGARFMPDGKSVVGSQSTAAGSDNTGRLSNLKTWDVASGKGRVVIHNAGILSGLNTDQGTLVTLANRYMSDCEIRVWDWPSGKRRLTIPANARRAALSPDGSRIGAAAWRAIKLWDARTGDLLVSIPTEGAASGLSFSPDGKRIAAGLENRRVVVFDLASGSPIAEDAHLDPVGDLVFSPDGKLLASSTLAGAINLGDVMPADGATTIGDVRGAPQRGLRFTSDGNALVVGHGGMTKVIDVAAGREIALLPARGVGTISADANTLARRAGDGDFDIWDVRASRKLWTVPFAKNFHLPPAALLSEDGSMLASFRPWSGDRTVTLWDLERQQSKVLDVEKAPHGKHSVSCVDFSRDGKLLAAGYQFYWVNVFDVATGAVKLQFAQAPAMAVVSAVAFSPSGQMLAAGTEAGAVTLLDVASGKQLVAYRGHATGVNALAFSPDGYTLATAGNDKTVRLWDVVTGQERGTLTGHKAGVSSVAFSPDGFTLATASADGTVKLWRGATDAAALAPRKEMPRRQAGPLILPTGAIALTEEGLREAVLRWPDEPELPAQLAKLLASRDRKDGTSGAEAELREAIRLMPDNGRLHFRLGELLAQQKSLPEALAAFREAARLNPSDLGVGARIARTLHELAKFAEAEKEFRELIRWRPDDFDYHYGLGKALVGQQKNAEAVAPLKEAIGLNPNHSGPRGTIGWALMKLAQFPEAEMEFREQIRLSPPNSSFGLYGLGSSLMKQRKHAEAIVPLRDLARVEPENHAAHETLGWALLLTGEPAKAGAEFREVIRLKPALAAGHWGLGRVLMEQKKYADAEAALREAIRLEPAHSEASEWLRRALIAQGKQVDAEGESDGTSGQVQRGR